MTTLQAIGILAIFAVCVVLMMTRKLPTILALPIMAVGIALVAGIPFVSGDPEQFTIAKDVLESGAMRMSTAIAGLIFGGWFGKILTQIGVTRTIIRKAAELAGDKPLPIALAFLAVCSVIFAASNGSGHDHSGWNYYPSHYDQRRIKPDSGRNCAAAFQWYRRYIQRRNPGRLHRHAGTSPGDSNQIFLAVRSAADPRICDHDRILRKERGSSPQGMGNAGRRGGI